MQFQRHPKRVARMSTVYKRPVLDLREAADNVTYFDASGSLTERYQIIETQELFHTSLDTLLQATGTMVAAIQHIHPGSLQSYKLPVLECQPIHDDTIINQPQCLTTHCKQILAAVQSDITKLQSSWSSIEQVIQSAQKKNAAIQKAPVCQDNYTEASIDASSCVQDKNTASLSVEVEDDDDENSIEVISPKAKRSRSDSIEY